MAEPFEQPTTRQSGHTLISGASTLRAYRGMLLLERLRADRSALTSELRNLARLLRLNFESFTSAVRYTNRVLRFPAIFLEDFIFEQSVGNFHWPTPECW